MDFLFHRRQAGQDIPLNFDFLEIQNIYLGHFDENKKKLGIVDCQMNFLNRNYTELQSDEFRSAYDLIVCNPPYFFPNIGKLSPSEFKNRCRFFIDSDLENLFLGIFHSLKKNGVCFMNLKDLPQYKLNVIELARNICKNKLNIEITGKIRGTHFLKVTQITN